MGVRAEIFGRIYAQTSAVENPDDRARLWVRARLSTQVKKKINGQMLFIYPIISLLVIRLKIRAVTVDALINALMR